MCDRPAQVLCAGRWRTADRVNVPKGAPVTVGYQGDMERFTKRHGFYAHGMITASTCTGRQRGKQASLLNSSATPASRSPPPPGRVRRASLAQSARRRAPALRRRAVAGGRLGAVPGARGRRPGADGGQLWAGNHRPVRVRPVFGHHLQRAAAAPEALCHPGLYDHCHRAPLAPAQ